MKEAKIAQYSLQRVCPLDPESGMTIGSAMDAAWGKLSDFEGWSSWVPSVTAAGLIGKEAPGRGAQLRVTFNGQGHDFTIAHWQPSRRLALVQQLRSHQAAYVFDFNGNENQLCLEATLELQCAGAASLLRIFLKARHLRRCHAILNSL
ncbi:MAG: hypothetical protein RL120_00225 [Gammaproteobacteria bacterium]